MRSYRYRLLNVFAIEGQRLSGNPLCVFEDARGLDDATMQALSLQFNLSETTFIFPSEAATARVRIFTPSFELPFAGHPTLGTAQVVSDLFNVSTELRLEMKAGIIPVSSDGTSWSLQANPPRFRKVSVEPAALADMLGLSTLDLDDSPLWVDTGTEQLLVPLKSADAVRRCQPNAELLRRHGPLSDTRFLVYVWAPATEHEIVARFFFAKGMSVVEDPATGSACANLGGWFIATQAALPLHRRVSQGEAVGRASQLELNVDAQQRITVAGRVIELGRGVIEI
ncbi:MAG: PhzF family phenazine biosynthesis protein [Steroidobacteraceae bacterium]